jgi:hypothetical protein
MDRREVASFVFEPGTTRSAAGLRLSPSANPKGRSMLRILRRRRALAMAITAAAASASIAYGAGSGPLAANAQGGNAAASSGGGGAANIHLFTPNSGDRSGLDSKGFFIDLKADMNLPLERSGFGGQGPAPGIGQDKRFPGLIVMLSTTKAGAGKNLAGLFDIVGVTDSSADKTQLWATWQAGKPNFGTGASTVYVAIAGDTNNDGVLNDAPNEVPDSDHDGDVDQKDLQAIGASSIKSVDFTING